MDQEQATIPKLEPMKAKLPTWLRPMTGVFSICAGLLYGVAILIAGVIYMGVNQHAQLTPKGKAAEVEKILKVDPEKKNVEETVQSIVDASQVVVDELGPIYLIFLAMLGALALLTVISGAGLLAKKPWSIGLGMMSSVGVIAGVILFFLVHHGSFVVISEDLMQRDLITAETGYGIMQSVRFAFLFCMCPAALFFAFKLIVKQLREG